MIDEWTIEETKGTWSDSFATTSKAASISYVNGDGAQRKNTWIWAIPAEKWIPDDYDNDEYSWFYAGRDGKLTSKTVKKINGKKYAFDDAGRMLTGFVAVDGDSVDVNVDDNNNNHYDHDKFTREEWINKKLEGFKYFSADEEKDGAMKTGYQNIELADDTYQFYFQKNGEAKTQYDNKIKKYTIAGLVLKPTNDDDNNYAAVTVVGDNEPTAIATDYDAMTDNENYHGDKVLINKQGSVIKNKTVKDENDQYFLTNGEGVIINSAKDKDVYDQLKKDNKWNKK